MTTALLQPHPLPLERMRPGVGLGVLVLHVGLLWVANLYWPLQSVLLGAVQTAAQSITVQIIQKSVSPSTPVDADNAALNANPQAISNAGRQRFGRAEAMLQLPDSQTESSTPLAATQQAVQTARAAQPLPARPAAVSELKPAPQPAPQPVPQPVPQLRLEVPPKPTLVPDVNPTANPTVNPLPQVTAAPELPQTVTTPSPLPTAASAAPAATAPVAAAQAPVVAASAATSSPASSVNTASNPGTSTATAAAPGSSAGVLPGSGIAAAPVLPTIATPSAGAPLNLSLPPRTVYRPPIAVPRRSLSEMANDQLRRKPRDALAEGIEVAGNIDCLKDTPDGPAQGLLAIGPLLKRAIEEKCRK
jgi:hypothetical protein